MMNTPFEINNGERWSTKEEVLDFLNELSSEERCEILTLGRSVLGEDLQAIKVGNPSPGFKTSALLVCSQHSNEPAPRESGLALARDLIFSEDSEIMKYLDKVDWYIVPTANPDRLHRTRSNANNADLNRDWLDFSQPETQAMRNILELNPIIVIDSHEGGISFDEPLTANTTHPSTTNDFLLYGAEMLYSSVSDKAISMGLTFDRWGNNSGAWRSRGMIANSVKNYHSMPIILESYQNTSNSISLPVPPSRAFDLRVRDNLNSYTAIVQTHMNNFEQFSSLQQSSMGDSPPPAIPEDVYY